MPRLPAGKEMTDKELAFCDEYLLDHNATQAAIRAGYSPRSAKIEGPRLRNRVPRVRDEIDRRIAARSARLGITADRCMELAGALLFANPKRYARWGGDGKMEVFDSSTLTDLEALAIGEIVEEEKFIKGGLGKDGDEVLMSRTTHFKLRQPPKLLSELLRTFGLLSASDGAGAGPGGAAGGEEPAIKAYTQEDWDRIP